MPMPKSAIFNSLVMSFRSPPPRSVHQGELHLAAQSPPKGVHREALHLSGLSPPRGVRQGELQEQRHQRIPRQEE
eukprot:54424-Amphidinium_carterae.1